MIKKFLTKVPAGMMVIPLLLGSVLATLCPQVLEIGGLTTALFSSAGTNTLLGVLLFSMGTTLQVRDMPKVLKRGGVLLLSKFAIGAVLGSLVGKIFGDAGFLGLSALAIVSDQLQRFHIPHAGRHLRRRSRLRLLPYPRAQRRPLLHAAGSRRVRHC